MSFYLLDHSSVNGTIWQQWGYPRRGASLSGTCILHTAESVLDVIGDDSGAEDCAAFIGRRTGSYGSYHDLVDSNSIIELAPFEYETWQDSETNPWAVGISAACRTTDWATMGEEKAEGYYRNLAWCAADFVKYMRTKGIEVPRRRITGAEARNRVPGFCAHGDSGIARTDPGADFDWARFFRYTNEILDGVVTTPNVVEKEKEMLYFADGGDGKIWVGNGILRYHVPDLTTLGHYRNVGTAMEQYKGGEVQKWNPAVLGLDLVSVVRAIVAGELGKQAVSNVALTESDISIIVGNIKEAVVPLLADELAKRLAN